MVEQALALMPSVGRTWIENGKRTVHILGATKDGKKYYVEWFQSGKWRKLRTPIPKEHVSDVNFHNIPTATMHVEEEQPTKSRRIRRKR